jgi:NAD(P)-dependent dehydrogenase (short-subunit alcohol dehydrogenase family)
MSVSCEFNKYLKFLAILVFVGARVILACRDEEKANQAIADIKKAFGDGVNVMFMKLDLASLKSVRDFAAAFCAGKMYCQFPYLLTVYFFVFPLADQWLTFWLLLHECLVSCELDRSLLFCTADVKPLTIH